MVVPAVPPPPPPEPDTGLVGAGDGGDFLCWQRCNTQCRMYSMELVTFYDCPVTYFQYNLSLPFGDEPEGLKKPFLYSIQ